MRRINENPSSLCCKKHSLARQLPTLRGEWAALARARSSNFPQEEISVGWSHFRAYRRPFNFYTRK